MVAMDVGGDRSIVASIVDKIQQGHDEVTSEDVRQIRNVLARDKAKSTAGEAPTIPNLDRKWLQQGQATANKTTLVRYVGMVQDMLDTEYYASQVSGVKTHYRDFYYASGACTPDDELDTAHNLAERHPLMLVPIPFVSEWFDQTLNLDMDSLSENKLQTDVAMDECRSTKRGCQELTSTVDSPPAASKTLRTGDADTPDTDANSDDTPVAAAPSTSSLEFWPAGCMGSNFNQCPVLAKLYYDMDERTPNAHRLRLNDVVELIGMVSFDPMEADFANQTGGEWDDAEDDLLQRTVLPPPSLLPRLHVLSYKTLKLDEVVAQRATAVSMSAHSSCAMDIEPLTVSPRDVIHILSRSVFGSTTPAHLVAAEALFLTLSSMAEREEISSDSSTTWDPVKTPADTTLGCASLNMVLPDAASCLRLQHRLTRVLQALVPVTSSLKLDRESLGKTIVPPAKSEQGRMVESPMQLPQGSALVINQATLSEGHVSPLEMESLQALASLSKSHSVPYRFDGNIRYTFEADYRVIILSAANGQIRQAGNRLLPCALMLPVSMQEEGSRTTFELDEKDAEKIRLYMARCRSLKGAAGNSNIAFSKQLLDCAQKDFVQRRADHRARKGSTEREIGEDDFHRWLTLTRLQARSRVETKGRTIAGAESWKDALRLDDAMRNA